MPLENLWRKSVSTAAERYQALVGVEPLKKNRWQGVQAVGMSRDSLCKPTYGPSQ